VASVKQYFWAKVLMPDLHPSLANKTVSMTQWPDFGKAKYMQEFVTLSALLTSRPYSFEELVHHSQMDNKVVAHFMNTARMLGLLEIAKDSGQTRNLGSDKKSDSFSSRLMRFIRSAYSKEGRR
jgi:hypothetical protein